jgi:hypothetical protein
MQLERKESEIRETRLQLTERDRELAAEKSLRARAEDALEDSMFEQKPLDHAGGHRPGQKPSQQLPRPSQPVQPAVQPVLPVQPAQPQPSQPLAGLQRNSDASKILESIETSRLDSASEMLGRALYRLSEDL